MRFFGCVENYKAGLYAYKSPPGKAQVCRTPEKLNLSLHIPSNGPLLLLLFFFFGWVTKNFINKETNPSTLGMYYGGINQGPKLQRSRKTRKMRQSHTPSKESM